MEHRQIIADNLRKAGFSWGCSSESDSTGRVLFTADAYAPDGRRLTVLVCHLSGGDFIRRVYLAAHRRELFVPAQATVALHCSVARLFSE
jgi:hypothetical protein